MCECVWKALSLFIDAECWRRYSFIIARKQKHRTTTESRQEREMVKRELVVVVVLVELGKRNERRKIFMQNDEESLFG